MAIAGQRLRYSTTGVFYHYPSGGGRVCGAFELGEPGIGLGRAPAAHFLAGAQPDADRGPLGPAKQAAAIIRRQLDAADAGRFAGRHAGDVRGTGYARSTGDGRRNRWGNTTGSAAYPAFHLQFTSCDGRIARRIALGLVQAHYTRESSGGCSGWETDKLMG